MGQKAKSMAVDVYRVTEELPRCELFGLTSQMRRAAVSVASNIAEGQGRLTKGEFRHFLGQSRGSLLELETQLAIAEDLKYVTPREHDSLEQRSCEVLRLLNGLLGSLRPGTAEPKLETRSSKPETHP